MKSNEAHYSTDTNSESNHNQCALQPYSKPDADTSEPQSSTDVQNTHSLFISMNTHSVCRLSNTHCPHSVNTNQNTTCVGTRSLKPVNTRRTVYSWMIT